MPETTNDKLGGTHAGNSSRFTKQTPVNPTHPQPPKKIGFNHLCAFPSNSPGQLDVLGHDGNPLCVDGAQIGVLKQSDQVCLAGFLNGEKFYKL